MKTEFI